jgi:hypothetical protein
MQAFIQHGLKNFLLSDPQPELTRSRADIDVLNESWQSDQENAFLEGAPHPERPGMIVDQVRTRVEVPGFSYVHSVTALGDSRGTRPTKLLNQSDARTLDIGWDEFTVEYLTWEARWKNCTGVASVNVVATSTPHGFQDGDRIVFRALTGGAPLVGASASALGTVYFVRWLTPLSFEVAATAGGAAIDLTTNITAGQVIAAEFARGAAHASYATMYLIDVKRSDENTDWQRVSVTYRGMMEPKPFKRIVTCNQQQISSSAPIIVSFPGGWLDARYATTNLPKIVCTDTYLTTDALATEEIPWSEDDGATPPDPPDIRSLFISGDLTWNWPNGWSRTNEEHLDSIPLRGVNLKRRVTEYVWPAVFR